MHGVPTLSLKFGWVLSSILEVVSAECKGIDCFCIAFFKGMYDLTVDTAGSGVLFNRKPLLSACSALEQALAVVPPKQCLPLLCARRERGDPRPVPWLWPHEGTAALVSFVS